MEKSSPIHWQGLRNFQTYQRPFCTKIQGRQIVTILLHQWAKNEHKISPLKRHGISMYRYDRQIWSDNKQTNVIECLRPKVSQCFKAHSELFISAEFTNVLY